MNPHRALLIAAAAAVSGLLFLPIADPAGAATSRKCLNLSPAKKTACLKALKKPPVQVHESSGEGGGGRGGGMATSDMRLKIHLHRAGTTVYGLPLYTFQYTFRPGTFEGVLAQDVLKVKPEAVSVGADGYYRVNYGLLGISMIRLD